MFEDEDDSSLQSMFSCLPYAPEASKHRPPCQQLVLQREPLWLKNDGVRMVSVAGAQKTIQKPRKQQASQVQLCGAVVMLILGSHLGVNLHSLARCAKGWKLHGELPRTPLCGMSAA